MLQAFDRVGEDERDEAEEQHGDGVFGPAHLVGLVYAGELVDEAFDRTKEDVEPGAFALEDTRHVEACGLCTERYQGEEEKDL